MMTNPFKIGSQKYRILEEMLLHQGQVENWKIVTPRPMGGLGIQDITARITEMRQELGLLGYEIENDPGKSYTLKKKEVQFTILEE